MKRDHLRSIRTGLLLPAVLLAMMASCGKKSEPQTPTSGYITVRGSDQTYPMMMEEAYAFMDLYPKAKVLVVGGGSNPAMAALFVDSGQVAHSTRPMTDDELGRAREAGFQVKEYKIAKDGIAIVVNPLNPVQQLTRSQVSDIFSGRIANWSKVGGRGGPISVHVWGENAGSYSYFKDSVLGGKAYAKRVQRFDNGEMMIRSIAENRNAVGFLSMALLYKSWSPLIEDTRIKALAIGLVPKGEFYPPDEATVHAGQYLFVRNIYLYTPNEPKGVDSGFITFVMSAAGQKIIAGNGFVPVTVPVKYTQDTL